MPAERRADDAYAVARYGTLQEPSAPFALAIGSARLSITPDGLGPVLFDGVEVLRGLAYPVRDADWTTAPATTVDETRAGSAHEVTYESTIGAGDFDGRFIITGRKDGDAVVLEASIRLKARTDAVINRAGFVLLHPLEGIVGEELTVTHSDGTAQTLAFPRTVSPSQPVFDIAGLTHSVHGIRVDIAFEGEVFEMEDQRNWTDASFKTYCRPLSAPRPFSVAAGEAIAQRVVITLSGRAEPVGDAQGAARRGVVPEIALAVDEQVQPLDEAAVQAIGSLNLSQIQLRIDGRAPRLPTALENVDVPLALEVVLPEGAPPAQTLEHVAAACTAANVIPAHVIALPEAYLASHQPGGPWPAGTTPQEATEAARAAFPEAEIGAGMLTNFTELNRCPPKHRSDYVTFGTTAIVHDADDRPVLETLEAMPDILASAKMLADGRPLRLGLTSIGMRSNPYGADVADNAEQVRLAMAQADPRQRGLFAAAFAVGVAAVAAQADIAADPNVACLAPAMVSGPLGIVHRPASWPQPGYEGEDAVYPLFHVVRALANLTGLSIEISGKAPGDLVTMRAPGAAGLCGLAANLGARPVRFDPPNATIALMSVDSFAASHDRNWLDEAPRRIGPVDLHPLDVAFLFAPETEA